MSGIFYSAGAFNQPLNTWNVARITSMSGMFIGARVFNHPLDNWNVSSICDMSRIFQNARALNATLNTWILSRVLSDSIASGFVTLGLSVSERTVPSFSNMFSSSTVFNQPLDNWNVSIVKDWSGMFMNGLALNQPSTVASLGCVKCYYNEFHVCRGTTF